MNDKQQEYVVDKETADYLEKMESRIVGHIQTLDNTLREVTGLRFEQVEKDMVRNFDQHEKFYQGFRDVEKNMTRLHETMIGELNAKVDPLIEKTNNLEARQSRDEGKENGAEKAVEGANRKTELTWLKVTGLLAIAVAAGGLIGKFIF